MVGKVQALDGGLEVLESLDTIAKRMGLEVSVSDLNIETITADDELAGSFGLSAGSKLTRVRRVVRADNRPVAYLVDVLPEDVLHLKDLPSDFNGSVLDFLLNRGDVLSSSRTNVSAIGATADVAKPLEIQRGDVLLHFNALLFDPNGRVVDASLSYFIPGYFHFHIVRRVGSS
ncbi:MAG: GntR family transcriptional regulator [Chloroflexi bacterium]|nr:GntR family transcriptional regulator [Chloroflexota bacterium]